MSGLIQLAGNFITNFYFQRIVKNKEFNQDIVMPFNESSPVIELNYSFGFSHTNADNISQDINYLNSTYFFYFERDF